MALERQGLAVGVVERAIGREFRAGQANRRLGLFDNLILVGNRHLDRLEGRVGAEQLLPDIAGADLILVQADAPALVRLFNVAAPCLGHDLMAEANTDHRRAAVERAQPVDQADNPRIAFVDAGGRSGNDDALHMVVGDRQLTLQCLENLEGTSVTRQGTLEHIGVGAVGFVKAGRRYSGFQNGNVIEVTHL